MNTDRIVTALIDHRSNFGGTDSKLATSLGINAAQLSRILKGDTTQVLSEQKWISIARLLQIDLRTERDWVTVATPVYQTITAQLEVCQRQAISAMLVDAADIGKSYTARQYAKTHKNVAHIDCSQSKSRTLMLRAIAKAFGVDHSGRIDKVYADVTYYLSVIKNPLIILDEAGDLSYEAFLELKALWNATEGACGWYMMGADGLKAKVERALGHQKVGYAEIFSRYGARYQRITPATAIERQEMMEAQAAAIIKANAPDRNDIQQLVRKTEGRLRRVYIELTKAA